MLACITSLGERSRHQRWESTFTGYLAGNLLGGGLSGLVCGLLGMLTISEWPLDTRLSVFVVAAAVGVVVEVSYFRRGFSVCRRQVNDDWLRTYRGGVYGVGFGFQLGLGLATVVTTTSVYLSWLGAMLTCSLVEGTVIGLAFGAIRACTLLPARGVRTSADLGTLNARLRGYDLPAKVGTLVVQLGIAAAGTIMLAV